MTTTRSIGVVVDRDHPDSVRVLTDLGWESVAEFLRAMPIVVAVAYTPVRVRARAPLVICVRERSNLALALHTAFAHLEGDCLWYIACDGESGRLAHNLVGLISGGTA